MRNITLNIALKIIGLVCLLVVLNFIYVKFFFESDLQKYSEVVNLVRAVNPTTDIVYVGESSNDTYRENDIDKRAISDMLSDFYPNMELVDITKPASHAGIYYELLKKIPEDYSVKTVVVTLNLRSFNAAWINSKLETPLQKSLVLLRKYPPLANRFLLSFKAYDIKSDNERLSAKLESWENESLRFPYSFPHKNIIEWDSHMAKKGVVGNDGKRDPEATQLACHYVKTYAFNIDTTNNPRIEDFNKIIQLAKERNWNLVFNLLAENLEKADELVGDDLVFLMEENRSILVDYFTGRNITVVDNLNLVENQEFIDQNWTTEHYAEKGRIIIAGHIANSMRSFHDKDFYKIDINAPRVNFFNNCEGRRKWGQIHTISAEHAFSGRYSSKTGQGEPFSVTFEYPLDLIPDSLRNRIKVRLMVYQNNSDHKSKFIFQSVGEGDENLWKGTPVSDFVTVNDKWEEVEIVFEIPEAVKSAKRIKFYVHNTSDYSLYVDDIEVKFE